MKIISVILTASVAFGLLSLGWWIAGATAGFNRGLDLIRSFVLIIGFIPLFIFIVFSIIHLFRGLPKQNVCESDICGDRGSANNSIVRSIATGWIQGCE